MDIDEIRNIIEEELTKISDADRSGEAYEKLVNKIIFIVKAGLENNKGNDEL